MPHLFYVSPIKLMRALTAALDLAVDGVGLHQLRTAIICRYIAEELKYSPADEQKLIGAALLHDIGAASYLDERRKIADVTQLDSAGLFTHTENGYTLLKDSRCFSDLAMPIRCHHDQWIGGNPSGYSGDNIPLDARIIHVADRVEIQIFNNKPILQKNENIIKIIKSNHGQGFDPTIIEAFESCSRKESFWLDLVNPEYASACFANMNLGQTQYTIPDMIHISELYATIIDRMSHFTATHSRSVSNVAVHLARQHGFCNDEQDLMKIAGLLHDLGKLSVPNFILEKPGPLTHEEQLIVRQHTFYTYRILEQIEQLETVAAWAAWHHETMDGQGYPFKLDKSTLTLGSLIMAVADIFVALAEDRPYRAKMSRDSVEKIMTSMASRGKISGLIVEILMDSYNEAEAALVNPNVPI